MDICMHIASMHLVPISSTHNCKFKFKPTIHTYNFKPSKVKNMFLVFLPAAGHFCQVNNRQTDRQTHTHTHTDTHTDTRVHTCMYTCMYTCTHTHKTDTHAHKTHTQNTCTQNTHTKHT